jgi:hypothetical protein
MPTGLQALGAPNTRVDTLQQRVTAYRQLKPATSLLRLWFSLRLARNIGNANFVPTIGAGGYQTSRASSGSAAL